MRNVCGKTRKRVGGFALKAGTPLRQPSLPTELRTCFIFSLLAAVIRVRLSFLVLSQVYGECGTDTLRCGCAGSRFCRVGKSKDKWTTFPRSSYSGMGGGSPRCRVVSDAPVGFDPVMGRTADLFVQRGSGAFSRTPLPSCVFADNAAGLTCSGPRTSLMC